MLQNIDQFLTRNLHGLGWPGEAFIELLLAALAGGLVGLEREVRGRQAGFRTYILVAVGSALVMIVSNRVAFHDWPHPPDRQVQVTVDPARIAYGVMTGVGFLGAGIIVQHKGNIRGLTTAAGVWCVAAIGLAAGLGLYTVALFTSVIVLVTLWVLDYLEKLMPKARYRNVVLRRPWADGCVEDTVRRAKAAGLKVSDVSYRRSQDLRTVDIDLLVSFFDRNRMLDVTRSFGDDGVVEVVSFDQS